MKYTKIVTAISIILFFTKPAFAYLDPGTGSAILQGILAGIAAIAVVAKLYWHRLLKIFGIGADQLENEDSKKKES